MRTLKWSAFLRHAVVGAAVASLFWASAAQADVTTENGASILVFPKVRVADGYNTVIQITNISNDLVFARCFYVNAQLQNPNIPEHPILNPPLWLETDFNIRLTRQQPTQWEVSRGRGVNPFDVCSSGSSPTCLEVPPGSGNFVDLAGLGIDPGAIPPVPSDFIGELKCVEVDASGTPIGGNHLKGEATIISPNGFDVAKYNAVGIRATGMAGAAGNDLWLNNRTGESSGMYDACPEVTIINHFADGAENPILGEGSEIVSELTVVPCSQDFENQIPTTVTLQFRIYNEFESVFSASTSVTCWKEVRLGDIANVFTAQVLGTTVAQTFMTPADIGDGGVIAVLEETHLDGFGNSQTAAINLHTEGDRFFGPTGEDFDRILLSGLF